MVWGPRRGLSRLQRQTRAERATFAAETARLRCTGAGLWRAVTHNYGQYGGTSRENNPLENPPLLSAARKKIQL